MIQSIADLIESLPKRKAVFPEEYYDERAALSRDLAFTVSGIAQLDAIQLILNSLDRNLKAGGSFAAWKRDVEAGEVSLSLPEHRKELIFRNHAQTAFAAGKCKNFADNKSARPYLMYSAIADSRTRPAHAKIDGIIRPVGDDWWLKNTPPNGHNCRCSVIALSEKQTKRMGGITENPKDGADPGWEHSPCNERAAGEEAALERKQKRYHPALRPFVSGLLQSLTAISGVLGS